MIKSTKQGLVSPRVLHLISDGTERGNISPIVNSGDKREMGLDVIGQSIFDLSHTIAKIIFYPIFPTGNPTTKKVVEKLDFFCRVSDK